MKHLDETELSALLDGALEDRARADAERHLAGCATCRAGLTALEVQHRSLALMLKHDPGAAYFETFAARVRDRIQTEGVTMDPVPARADAAADRGGPARPIHAPARDSLLERLGRWFTGPRLAWAGAAVAMIVGAGVVFLVDNEPPVRTLEDRTLAARARQVAERTPAPAATMAAPEPGARATRGATGSVTPSPQKERAESRAFAPPPPATASDARESAVAQKELATALDATSQVGTASPLAPATPSGPAAKPQAGALPGRSRQVQRENGEDVPVQVPGETPPGTNAPLPANRADANVSKAQRIKGQARTIAGGPLDAARKTGDSSQSGAPGTTAFTSTLAGEVRVCGEVKDVNGRAIEGARVALADMGSSTTTDKAGRWCLVTPPGEHTVTVMAVGFREMRRSFGVTPAAGNQDFTLAAVSVLGQAADESDAAPPAWPPAARGIASAAERASRDAEYRNTASAHDSAATRWQKVTEVVKIGPSSHTARLRLAEARYRAWQIDPSPERSTLAMAALSSYLGVAPSGPERERAQRSLEQLQRR